MAIIIGKVRSLLCGGARVLGDAQAVKKGRIVHRIIRRAASRVTERHETGRRPDGHSAPTSSP
jgi:hypothetical protein